MSLNGVDEGARTSIASEAPKIRRRRNDEEQRDDEQGGGGVVHLPETISDQHQRKPQVIQRDRSDSRSEKSTRNELQMPNEIEAKEASVVVVIVGWLTRRGWAPSSRWWTADRGRTRAGRGRRRGTRWPPLGRTWVPGPGTCAGSAARRAGRGPPRPASSR